MLLALCVVLVIASGASLVAGIVVGGLLLLYVAIALAILSVPLLAWSARRRSSSTVVDKPVDGDTLMDVVDARTQWIETIVSSYVGVRWDNPMRFHREGCIALDRPYRLEVRGLALASGAMPCGACEA